METETPIKTEDMANGESSSQSGGGSNGDQQNYALALNEEDGNQQVLGDNHSFLLISKKIQKMFVLSCFFVIKIIFSSFWKYPYKKHQLALPEQNQSNTPAFDPAKHSFSPEELQVAPVRSKVALMTDF